MSWARLAAGCLLALIATDAALASGALQQSFLQPMGPVAQEQSTHLMRVVGITMIVILPVLVGVPLCVRSFLTNFTDGHSVEVLYSLCNCCLKARSL